MSAHLEGLNLVELLDLLEPVPEPEPVSWAPQTAGWIWLGLAMAIATFLLLRRFVRHRRASAYRRAALAELSGAGDDSAAVELILRRAALAGFPRSRVAHLHGTAWLEFLDQGFAGTGFADSPGRAVAEAPFIPYTDPAPGLNDLARNWIRRHRPGDQV